MTIPSDDGAFLILSSENDHNDKKWEKRFKEQSRSVWLEAIKEVSRIGKKIVRPYIYSTPFIVSSEAETAIKNVVNLEGEINTIKQMKWQEIIAIVLEKINEQRIAYNNKPTDEFFSVKKLTILLKSNGRKIELNYKSPKENATFLRIQGSDFLWLEREYYSRNSPIFKGHWTKFKKNGKIVHFEGYCNQLLYSGSSHFSAILTQASIKTIPMLDKNTMWKEGVFDPKPFVREPVVMSDGLNLLATDERLSYDQWNSAGAY